MEPLGLAPTTAIDPGEKRGRRSMAGRVAATIGSGSGDIDGRRPSADDRADAALLERARDDQPLDLAGALPEAVDAQLAQEALRRELAHVAAAAEHLDDAVRATPRRLGREQLGERRLGVDDLLVHTRVHHRRGLTSQEASGGS